MKNSIYRYWQLRIITLAVLALFQGFFAMGCVEVASDRGVTYGSPDRDARTGVNNVQFEVLLLSDQDSSPVPGVKVSAETTKSRDADTTNSLGKAVLNASINEDDSIDFYFKSTTLEWSRTIYSIPRGQAVIKLIFKSERSGKVRLIALEY